MADSMSEYRSLPLTDLSEDERVFREVVRDFAEEKIRPLVRQMDEESKHPARADRRLLRARADGRSRSPRSTAASGATFFMSTLAIEELARVDAAVAVLVDVQNTLVNNALLRWGNEAQKAKYFPQLAIEVGGGLRALRGGLGLGRLRARLPGRGQGRPLRAHRPQALDHERGRGRAVHRDGDARPAEGLQGHHELPGREVVPRLQRRQEGGQARDPRLLDLRADPRGLPRAEGERARRARARATRSRSRRSTRAASGSARRWRAWPRGRSSWP